MYKKAIFLTVLLIAFVTGCLDTTLVAPDAPVKKIAGGFAFTEGPVGDKYGNIFFTDIPNNRIHKCSSDNKLFTFMQNSGAANGLYLDKNGNLIACQGGKGQVVQIDMKGNVKILADKFNGKSFNSPNDLWLDPKGGIYFSDPRYGNRDNLPQDGEHVYYIAPDTADVIRVIDDMVRPNGLIGTANGKKLYVTDHGGGETYSYKILPDGTLTDKAFFAPEGSDGMTIDNKGNIYLTTDAVKIYNSKGELVETIQVPERPANVTFGGIDKDILYITARTSLYAVKMQVKGL